MRINTFIMKKLTLLLLVSSIAFCSCEDFVSNLLGDKIELEVDVEQGENGEGNSTAELPVIEFKSEQEIEAAVKDIQVSLYEYMRLQKAIDKSIIVDKDFESVTSTNPLYEEAWNAAYETITRGNLCTRSLERAFESFDQQIIEKYLANCSLVIGFTYKNLFEHWGNVPVITQEASPDAMLMTAHEDEVMAYAIEMLERSRNIFEQDNHHPENTLQLEASLLASAEICGCRDINRSLNFCMKATELNPDKETVYEVSGSSGNIIIYTTQHAKLYFSEFTYILGRLSESEIADLNELISRWSLETYGYWSMLKRNKKFTEQVGCPQYMQYLPVPQSILEQNPGVMQNPGY